MRYAAPSDVSGITLSTGPLTVVDGFVDVPDDASPGDIGGLAVYNFVPAPESAPAASAPSRGAALKAPASGSTPPSENPPSPSSE